MKNKILFIITKIAIVMVLISALMLDSESIVPIIVMAMAEIWLLLFYQVNKETLLKRPRKESKEKVA